MASRTGTKRGILCLGNAIMDIKIGPVEERIRRGKLDYADNISLVPGGCALNSAVASARMGVKTGVVAVIGRDDFGVRLAKTLSAERIEVSAMPRLPGRATSTNAVLIHPDGERSFIYHRSACQMLDAGMVPDRLLKSYGFLHCSGFLLFPRLQGKPAISLLKRASRLGLVTSLDISWIPGAGWSTVKPVLPYVDYLLPSLSEARMALGGNGPESVARRALKAGVRRAVILKMGAKGCLALTREGDSFMIPSAKVRVADATGAGDSFDGVFLASLARGCDFAESLCIASSAGAQVVSTGNSAFSLGSFAFLEAKSRRMRIIRGKIRGKF